MGESAAAVENFIGGVAHAHRGGEVESVRFPNHSFLSTGFQSQTDPIRDARAPEIAGFEPKIEFPTG